jgi:endonuclease V-like protein UPF0215 family
MSSVVKFREIKREIRILGVDDGGFIHKRGNRAEVIGVVFRGGHWMEGIMFTDVEVDGTDATERIAEMIVESPHMEQVRVIITDGLTFAGFNVVDITSLFDRSGIPVIAVADKKPDVDEVKKALKNLSDWEKRWTSILNAGEMITVNTQRDLNPLYVQIAGINKKDAVEIVVKSATRSRIPEPLRVAHLIASGLTHNRNV